jgi:hypothetical protein
LELRPLLGLLLFAFYVVNRIRSAYGSFYGPLGLSPDDLGLGYLDLLAQSAVAAVVLLVTALLLASIFVLPVAGLEFADLSLPTGFAALLVVILPLVLSKLDDGSSRGSSWRPCARLRFTASASVSRGNGLSGADRRASGRAWRSRSARWRPSFSPAGT